MPSIVKNNSRTGKSTVNLLTGVLSQLVILVLNFAVRYVFIQNIGYEYLGINSLFTSILTVLSVADLGFGSALGIVLYSSLSRKNEEEIAGLMNFFKKVYLIIGLVVTAAGLITTPFVKYLVNTNQDIPHLSLYFLLFLLNTVSSYFISYRAILIRADQKNSVVNNVTTIVKVAKAILEVLVLVLIPKLWGLTATYFIYLGVMVLSTYAIGFITSVYAKKKYAYAFRNKVTVSEEKKKDIISTTKDLFIYRLCSAFSSPIDSIIISLFVGTLILGVYSNYLLILTTLLEFICLISRNVISSVGNFVVERPLQEQKKLYFEMQVVYFAIIIFCTINFVSLVSPFISLVFKPESALSIWVVFLLGATLITRCIGELFIIFRETTRIYKKTKYISLFYTAIHVGLSLLFGYYMGLEGILLGNVIAYFITNFWFELFALFKWYFKEKSLKAFGMFFYVILLTCGLSVGMYYLSEFIYGSGGVVRLIITAGVSLLVSSLALLALYPLDGFKFVFRRVKRIVLSFYNKISFIYKSKKVQISVLIGYVVILAALVLARDIFGVNINKFIFLFLIIAALLVLNKKNAIAVIMFTLPISPSLAELYILILSLAYLIFASAKCHKIKNWAIIFAIPLLIFVLELVLSFVYGYAQFNLAFRIFVLLSILAIVFYDRKIFTKFHLMSFVVGVLFLLAVLSINWIVPAIYGVKHRGKTEWLTLSLLFKECRFGFSTGSWILTNAHIQNPYVDGVRTTENPNNIGLLSIVSIATLFSIYGTYRRKGKISILLMMSLLVAFGIWSQSRTFIIILLAFVLIMIFAPFIAKRKSLLVTLLYLSFAITVASIVLFSSPAFIKNIINRFSEKSTATGGGRFELIGDYFRFIFSDWRYALFGVGCSSLRPLSGIEVVPHTNFVQFIGSYGLLTFIFFITFLVFSFIKTKRIKIRSGQLYLLLPVLFTVGFTLTLQLFLPSIVLLSFIPGVGALSFLNKEIDNGKKIEYYPALPSKVSENDTLRLAMCSTSFGGGIGSYISNVYPFFKKCKVDATIVLNPNSPESDIKAFSRKGIKKITYAKSSHKLKIKRLIDKYDYYLDSFYAIRPDVVYVNTSSFVRALVLIFAAIKYKGAKIIVHCHINSELSFAEKVARWFITFEKIACFACSKESGKSFFGKSFLENKNNHDAVITNFINTDKFPFNEKYRDEIRTKLNFKKDDIVIGNVGRFDPQKNQKFIVDVISKLPPRFKLVLIGGGGDLKPDIERQIVDLKLQKRITMIDSTDEIYKYYNAFDYFALPSIKEGLPFVCVEAQCCGAMNILSSELSDELKMSNIVVFLPLNVDSWCKYFLESKPVSFKERSKAYQAIIDAGYSNKTTPYSIINIIKEIAYE